jgi:hypothetical protein
MGAELDAVAREALVEALAEGVGVSEAARRSGYSRKHVYTLREDERFMAEVERRKAELAAAAASGEKKPPRLLSPDEKLALDTLRAAAAGELEGTASEIMARVTAAKAILGHEEKRRGFGAAKTKPGPGAAPPEAPAQGKPFEVIDGKKAAAEWMEKQA